MKNLKTLSVSLAFTIAIIAAISSTPLKAQSNFITVRGWDSSCPIGWVSADCELISVGTICTFYAGFITYLAVPYNATNCETAQVLRILN